MNSNWSVPNPHGGDYGNIAQNGYLIDNVGLQQLGCGLPLQMLGLEGLSLGAPMQDGLHFTGTSNNQFASGSNCSSQATDTEIKQTVDGIPIRKLYITNIPQDFTYNDLSLLFGRFGQVYHIYIGTSKGTYRNSFVRRQFAFVTYRFPKDATRVLKIGRIKDQRRRFIYVSAADSWHQPTEGPNGQLIMPPRFPGTKPNDESFCEEDDSGALTLESLAPVQVQEGGLNGLNDDCLLHVFSFLTYKEISGVERVCKRWQGLSYRIWKCLHKLDLTKAPFKRTKMTTAILEHHLKRCGEFLTLLELTGRNNAYSEAALAVIAKYCVNLEVLRVEHLNLGNRTLAHLGRCCTKLKHLTIDHCQKFNDNDLMSALPKCQQLCELNLYNANDVNGKFLANLQGPITSLRLHKCSSIKSEYLLAGAQKVAETLQHLSLICCGQNKLNDVLSKVPNLTSLTLSRPSYTFYLECPISISGLSKLTHLDLTQNSLVNNKVLFGIVNGCKELTHLNLSSSGSNLSESLTEEGLSVVGRLSKLTHLELSYLEVTTDQVLKNITNRNPHLKELLCRACSELTDDGCSHVVSMCNDLELFDLSACEVGCQTMSAALTSVKMRTNNVRLKLVMGGTSLESTELPEGTEPSPLLIVDMSDLSNEMMRPDHLFFSSDEFSDDEEDADNLCCDCEFECDDLVDPTLFPSDFEDDSVRFRGFDDDYDEDGLDDWTDDDDDDDIYTFQKCND